MQVKPDKSIADCVRDSLRDMKKYFDEQDAIWLLRLWGHSQDEAKRIVQDIKNASETE